MRNRAELSRRAQNRSEYLGTVQLCSGIQSECSGTLAHTQQQSKNTCSTEQNSNAEVRIEVSMSERFSCVVEFSRSALEHSRTLKKHIRTHAEQRRTIERRRD